MHLVYLAVIRMTSLERHGEKRQMYQGTKETTRFTSTQF